MTASLRHRLLAIMGPSGGGKTTLLNALAGQVPATKGMSLRGSVALNGQPRHESAVRQAYVQQEDMFYAQLTVRSVELDQEILSYSLLLKVHAYSTVQAGKAAHALISIFGAGKR